MRKTLLLVPLILCAAFTPSGKKVEYLANVIYAEAGGETLAAKMAVATVIWERANNRPENIHSVITTPNHFASPRKEDVDEWNDCMNLAKQMYEREFEPITINLPDNTQVYPDHFYHGKAPYWARGKMHSKIGNLRFLRLSKEEVEN